MSFFFKCRLTRAVHSAVNGFFCLNAFKHLRVELAFVLVFAAAAAGPWRDGLLAAAGLFEFLEFRDLDLERVLRAGDAVDIFFRLLSFARELWKESL
jgi:hypothetical protein